MERKKARIAAALVTYAGGDEVDCIFTPALGPIVYHQVERLKDESLAKQALEDIIEICTIVDTTQVDFYAAFRLKRNDFEDEMMIACALRKQATIKDNRREANM